MKCATHVKVSSTMWRYCCVEGFLAHTNPKYQRNNVWSEGDRQRQITHHSLGVNVWWWWEGVGGSGGILNIMTSPPESHYLCAFESYPFRLGIKEKDEWGRNILFRVTQHPRHCPNTFIEEFPDAPRWFSNSRMFLLTEKKDGRFSRQCRPTHSLIGHGYEFSA